MERNVLLISYPLRSCRVVTASDVPSLPGLSSMFPQSGWRSNRTSASVRETGLKQLIQKTHTHTQTLNWCINYIDWGTGYAIKCVLGDKPFLRRSSDPVYSYYGSSVTKFVKHGIMHPKCGLVVVWERVTVQRDGNWERKGWCHNLICENYSHKN